MAVFIPVCGPDGEMRPLIKDKSRRHIIRQEADLHFRIDELHRHIVGYPVDRNGCVLLYLAGDAVQETFLQPFPGFWHADGRTGLKITFHRSGADPGMERSVAGTDVVP